MLFEDIPSSVYTCYLCACNRSKRLTYGVIFLLCNCYLILTVLSEVVSTLEYKVYIRISVIVVVTNNYWNKCVNLSIYDLPSSLLILSTKTDTILISSISKSRVCDINILSIADVDTALAVYSSLLDLHVIAACSLDK